MNTTATTTQFLTGYRIVGEYTCGRIFHTDIRIPSEAAGREELARNRELRASGKWGKVKYESLERVEYCLPQDRPGQKVVTRVLQRIN